jgi:hypothetical protein
MFIGYRYTNNPSGSDSDRCMLPLMEPLTIETLLNQIPSRIRLGRQLIKEYMSSPEKRVKLFAALAKSEIEETSEEAERLLTGIADLLLYSDGSEEFDKASLNTIIQKLSKLIPNPNFGDPKVNASIDLDLKGLERLRESANPPEKLPHADGSEHPS